MTHVPSLDERRNFQRQLSKLVDRHLTLFTTTVLS
jgi:hypothetical protein